MKRQLEILAGWIQKLLIEELERQGHKATGQLINSVEVAVNEIADGFEIQGHHLYYGRFVDTGRKAGVKRVPIDALIDWLRIKKMDLRGNSERQVAFAIQRAIYNKGIPTDGDQKKKRWMSGTLEVNAQEIDEKIRGIAGYYVDLVFDNMIERTRKEFEGSVSQAA